MRERLGRYRITERIAVGGMAELFGAVVESEGGFRRRVALKVLLPHFAEDPEHRRMFLDEARLWACLSHGNVVQVFDFGEFEGALFLAMEWVEGCDLSRLSKALRSQGEALSPQIIAWVLAESAAGLQHAHHRLHPDTGQPLGIVHRDISPHNLLCSLEGEVKVTDFGIALAAEREARTQTGMVKGKLPYMAPEQAVGRSVTPAADIWALGVVLWEQLAGRSWWSTVPESGEAKLYDAVIEARIPPIAEQAPAAPPELRELCSWCLELMPEERPGSAGELERELRRYLAASGEGDERHQLAQLMRRAAPRNPPTPKHRTAVLEAEEPLDETATREQPRVVVERITAPEAPAEPSSEPPPEVRSPLPARRRRLLALAVLLAIVLGAALASRDAATPAVAVAPIPSVPPAVRAPTPPPAKSRTPKPRESPPPPVQPPKPRRVARKASPPPRPAAPPREALSIRLRPWGRVSIQGKSLGEGRAVNATLPRGDHELLLEHPVSGVQRRCRVAVRANMPRLSVIDLSSDAIACPQTPQAPKTGGWLGASK